MHTHILIHILRPVRSDVPLHLAHSPFWPAHSTCMFTSAEYLQGLGQAIQLSFAAYFDGYILVFDVNSRDR